MKKKTTINVEKALIDKAKSMGVNISQFTEDKLKSFLYSDEIPKLRKFFVNKISYCKECKKKHPLNTMNCVYYPESPDKCLYSTCDTCYDTVIDDKDFNADKLTRREIVERYKDDSEYGRIGTRGIEMVEYLLKERVMEESSKL